MKNTKVENKIKECEHYFEYSHLETRADSTITSANYQEVRIVICRKCGEIREQ